MWPDLAKFGHFGNILKVLGICLRVYLLLCKISNLHWQLWFHIGPNFRFVNGQNWTNNIAVWSHWLEMTGRRRVNKQTDQTVKHCLALTAAVTINSSTINSTWIARLTIKLLGPNSSRLAETNKYWISWRSCSYCGRINILDYGLGEWHRGRHQWFVVLILPSINFC